MHLDFIQQTQTLSNLSQQSSSIQQQRKPKLISAKMRLFVALALLSSAAALHAPQPMSIQPLVVRRGDIKPAVHTRNLALRGGGTVDQALYVKTVW